MGTLPRPPSWVPGLMGLPVPTWGSRGNKSFFTAEGQPLFTHPQDRCRKGHKDPIPRWLCSGSCTQGNFEGLVSTSLPPTHSLTHCELLPTPVSAERASSCPENGHTPFLLPTLSGLPPATLPGAGCPLLPLRPVPLDGDAPKVSSRPSFDIGLCGHACTRTYEFLGPCRPPAPYPAASLVFPLWIPKGIKNQHGTSLASG